MEGRGYAAVVVDLSIPAADKVFHYRIPLHLRGSVGIGDQVEVPFQRRRLRGYVIELIIEPDVGRVRDIIKVVTPGILDEKRIELAMWMAARYNCYLIEALRCLLPPGGGERIPGRKEKRVKLAIDPVIVREEITLLERRAPKQAQVLRYLLEQESAPRVQVLRRGTGTSAAPLKSLISKGLVEIEGRDLPRQPLPGRRIFVSSPPETLTWEQERAVRTISCSLNDGKSEVFLLHGITGSGKTEVYLKLIKEILDMGKGAIVLVPEISLTPQTVARFQARFGSKVAVLHSRLSKGERYDEWSRVYRGECPIVVGARSAVFAPVTPLGLIIIDEEHELTYKQEENPRYQTREVAEFRTAQEGGGLLLGSATPCIETYYRAVQGQYRLLQLTARVDGQSLPEVEVVDMRKELEQGNRSIFSRSLQAKLDEMLKRREQGLIFLNRRGFASFVLCRQCGYVATCPNCDVSLTYHSGERRLRCHYCYHEELVPGTCPVCSSGYIRHFGLGTERVEAELERLFPWARVLRMDMDTTRGKNSHSEMLEDFALGKVDILVGTQMIAKGLDFPRIGLVGVVSADTSLNFPDFRAGERTFQLLTQVAGRAGRGMISGRVVIQTYSPEHYSIQAACKYDYKGFFQEELRFRKKLQYPPFSQLIKIMASGTEQEKTRAALGELVGKIRSTLTPGCSIYGPGPAFPGRIRGKYRYQVLVKGQDLNYQSPFWRDLRQGIERSAQGDLAFNFDFSPVSVL